MPCDTTRPGTVSGSKTSPRSPTQSSFSLTVSCLRSRCEQVPESQGEGMKLTSLTITTVTSTASSIHTDILSTHPRCNNVQLLSSPPNKCPAYRQSCYTCGGCNHYTVLCKQQCKKIHHASPQYQKPQKRQIPPGTPSPSAMDDVPVSHLKGSCATTHPAVASPAATLLAVPPTVHPPVGLTSLITNVPPSSIPRTK